VVTVSAIQGRPSSWSCVDCWEYIRRDGLNRRPSEPPLIERSLSAPSEQ
jgi:hypothetical protein